MLPRAKWALVAGATALTLASTAPLAAQVYRFRTYNSNTGLPNNNT